MKKIFLTACFFATVLCTSCDPQGTSHSGSGAEASPQNDIDTVSEHERDPVPSVQDSSGRVADPSNLKQ